MKRSEERILTTHVGSLIRPAELMAAGEAARGGGPGAEADYLELLQSVTAEVVKKQTEAGIDIVNDGEYGKSSWAAYVLERMIGFARCPGSHHAHKAQQVRPETLGNSAQFHHYQ